jgi:hypothetical protein
MAKKDDTFNSFMEHEILKSKYKIDSKDVPRSVLEGKKSKNLIIASIAEIADSIDGIPQNKKNMKQTFELLSRLLNS